MTVQEAEQLHTDLDAMLEGPRKERSMHDIASRIREFRDVYGAEAYADLMMLASRLVAYDIEEENAGKERYQERAS